MKDCFLKFKVFMWSFLIITSLICILLYIGASLWSLINWNFEMFTIVASIWSSLWFFIDLTIFALIFTIVFLFTDNGKNFKFLFYKLKYDDQDFEEELHLDW